MEPEVAQWDEIFKRDGRVFPEPAPLVMDFAALLETRSCKTALDLGCGTGRHVVHLAKQGFFAVGLDNSPTGLHLTREWLENKKYETVRGTAREITRITRAGGMILISAPARGALDDDAKEHIEIEPDTFVPTSGSEQGLPHHLFTPERLLAIFPQFEVMDLQIVEDRIMVAHSATIIALTAVKKGLS